MLKILFHFSVCFVLHIFCAKLLAQDKSGVKFGKISKEDFRSVYPLVDSGAHALILADIGLSQIIPNKEGGFGYEFQRKMRVLVLDQVGSAAGKFVIPLYSAKNSDDKEVLTAIKAVTYNLEADKIIEAKLESDQVFAEKTDKHLQLKKFALPALKKGSIFELSYTISSDFLFEFRSWQFQQDYPCLWSELQTKVPQFYEYVFLVKGGLPFHIATKKDDINNFLIRDALSPSGLKEDFTITSMVHSNRWVIKDIPALKTEAFTTTAENYRSQIDFQLSSLNFPGRDPQPVMDSWQKVSKDLMAHEYFGQQLDKYSPWINEYAKEVVGNENDPLTKARMLFSHVRNNFSCIQNSGKYISGDLKAVLKTKNGNVADINLLLTGLLKQSGIDCNPVLLSTRSHGFAHAVYPLLDRYNYVICKVYIAGQSYLLDASIPNLGFGKLSLPCYNGYARELTSNPVQLVLSPDSIVEKSTTIVFVQEQDGVFQGKVTSNPGYFESFSNRNTISEKGAEVFFDKIRAYFGEDYKVFNGHIDSLHSLEDPVKVTYEFSVKHSNADILYLNPVLVPFYKENPLVAAVRQYPVEMPYRTDESFILNLKIPDGYVVEELPKSARVKLNENDGYFEYLITINDGFVQFKTSMRLNKSEFMPDEYDSLRDFFGMVLNKQSEQIVLKKK